MLGYCSRRKSCVAHVITLNATRARRVNKAKQSSTLRKKVTTAPHVMAALSSSSSAHPEHLQQLSEESTRLRTQIRADIDEADDPLALYDQFVKWTFDKYPPEYIGSSGLLELLEEATRRFKDDASYKGDLRYFKMWSMYASLVDKPGVVFKFLLSRGIGTVYAQLYEEYALVLERDNR